MKKFIISIFVYFLFLSINVSAEMINDITVKNNNRISKQTIITYGNIELNKDYNLSDVNQVFRNLYETDFFESLKIDIVDNQLVINVKENKIIANVSTEGVESKRLAEVILKNTFSKEA